MRTVKNSRKDQLKHRFSILSPDKIPTGKIGKDTLLKNICQRSIQKDENKTNHRTTSYKKSKEILGKNKLLVTVIFFVSKNKEQNVLYHSPLTNKILKQLFFTVELMV